MLRRSKMRVTRPIKIPFTANMLPIVLEQRQDCFQHYKITRYERGLH